VIARIRTYHTENTCTSLHVAKLLCAGFAMHQVYCHGMWSVFRTHRACLYGKPAFCLAAFFVKSLFFNGCAVAIKPGLQSAYISGSRDPNAADKNTSG
jgi:hypothetical protein